MPLEMSSPVLIYGDPILSKNAIVSAKKKYKNAHWEVVSATKTPVDEIRMIAGFNQFGVSDKIVMIEDIPNKKAVREFILDIVRSSSPNLKFILWDSNGHIKIDTKTKEIMKTWSDFVNTIKKMPGSKVIDQGEDFTDKENVDCNKFVHDCFKKYGKSIDDKATIVLIDIVGRNRGMLFSEIQKLSINCPVNVDMDFIVNNTFPTSSEAVLYKFGNALDSANISISLMAIEEFISHGINEHVLSVILMKKVRWQLVVAQLWHDGMSWNEIPDEMMRMGKFPSIVWHDSRISELEKKHMSTPYTACDSKIDFMIDKLGFPYYSFVKEKVVVKKEKEDGETEKKERQESGECIPLRFMAQQIVDFVRGKIVEPNRGSFTADELKEKVLKRAMATYLSVSDLMKNMRYEQKEVRECLYQMARAVTDTTLIDREIV